MSKFKVTTDTLDQAASNLDSIRSQLTSLKNVPASDKTALGGMEAFTAFDDFSHDWSYGVGVIDDSIGQMASGLRQASKTYKDGEATITAAMSHGNGPGGQNGGNQPGSPGNSGANPGTPGTSPGGQPGKPGTVGTYGPQTVDNTHSAAWAKDLLLAMGAPLTAINIQSITAWIDREGNPPDIDHYNPLDTTMDGYGGVSTNGVGVKSYSSWQNGIAATVATLKLSYYPEIYQGLMSGKGLPKDGPASEELLKWSGGGYAGI